MRRYIIFAIAALAAAGLGGCGGDGSGAGSDGGADAGADADTDADAGGDADSDADTDTDTDTELFWLAPEDIGFEELDPPLAGDCIYFLAWGPPDTLEMIAPDGAERGTRFRVDRLWSFGVAHDGVTVAFSSADPYQEEHWDVTVGDAIQYTWLLAPDAAPAQITAGNINDECHLFSADDATLYMCRRANFWQVVDDETFSFGNDSYRILTHDLATAAETWLTPLVENVEDIGPAPLPSGEILFWRQEADLSQGMMRMDADGSGIAAVRDGATNPVASPGGDLVAFRQDWRQLVVAPADDLGGGAAILDGGEQFFYDFSFSPDATRIAYLLGHEGSSCSDLWVAGADGSAPAMLIDCVAEGVFPTGLQWSYVE